MQIEKVVLIATTTITTSANPITNSQGSQKSQNHAFCLFVQTKPKIGPNRCAICALFVKVVKVVKVFMIVKVFMVVKVGGVGKQNFDQNVHFKESRPKRSTGISFILMGTITICLFVFIRPSFFQRRNPKLRFKL